jgi:outer membrane protein OmpA-like peptidoglycan-associated protein
MKMNGLAAVAMVVGLLGAAGVQAQSDAQAPTITGETGGFSLFSGDTLRQGTWSFGIYISNWDRLFDIDDADATDIDEISIDWTEYSASIGYGITDRWEVALMVPYDDFNFDEDDFRFDVSPDSSGWGRVRLGSKWTVSGDRDADRSLAVNAFVELPTGDDDISDGDQTGFGVGLDWRVRQWLINVGYDDAGSDDFFGQAVTGGVGYLGSISDQFFWITELDAAFQTGDSPIEDHYDLTSGGRYWFGPDSDWAFNFGLRVDLNQLSDISDQCPLGGLIGLTYRPRLHAAPPPPEPPPAPAPVAPPPPPPPAPEPVAPPPPAPAPKPETREECGFPAGGARLSNICKAKFDEVALQLKQDPSATAEIIGYSDSSGSDAANQKMSEARAKAVMDYLVTRHGIDPSRITSRGAGSADPVASNDSAEGRSMNRRVVIIVRGS